MQGHTRLDDAAAQEGNADLDTADLDNAMRGVAVCARRVAEDGQTAFVALGDDMGRIRTAHTEIGKNLLDFADRVAEGDAGADKLHALETAVDSLLAALVRFLSELGGSEARTQVRDTYAYLEAIDRAGKTLTAISTLTRTTASAMGVLNLDRYLNDLRDTASGIVEAVDTVGHKLDELTTTTRNMQKSCAEAADTLRKLKPRLSDRRKVLVTLTGAEERASEDLSGRAKRLSEEGKRHIKIFITTMQFSDRLSQRLDHVAMMLERDPAQLARLAAAQARRCASDIAEIAEETGSTMGRLAELGRRGAALFSDGALAEAIADALQTRTETVAMVRKEMAGVNAVVEAAQSQATQAAKTAEQTGQSFSQLSENSKTLAIASINSMLFSARSGRASGPLVALSTEVRQTAADCLSAVGGGQAGLNALIARNDLAHGRLVDATDTLSTAVLDYDGLTEADAARLEDINRMRGSAQDGAETLLTLVAAVDQSLASMGDVQNALLALAADLDALPGQVAPDPGLLADIWSTYTMDEERAVHAEIFSGTEHAPPAAPQSAAVDDIDDLFF